MEQVVATPRTVLIDNAFNDFSRFKSSVKHWDLDFTLLGKGFDAQLHYSLINNAIFGKVSFNCRIEQQGNCPEGMRTFVIPASNHVNYKWRKFEIMPNVLQLFPKNGELYSISNVNFDCYVISFPETQFLQILNEFGYDHVTNFWDNAFVWRESQETVKRLRIMCADYQKGWLDPDSALLHSLVSRLVRGTKMRSSIDRRQGLVETTLQYLSEKDFDIAGIGELTSITGCSERTLQYAFKEEFGISPMTYVKRTKLRAVFNDLMQNTEAHISEIANKYGFWHMGQFAQDFRRVYGQLPSKIRSATQE